MATTKIIDPDQGTGYDYQYLKDWEAWLDNSTMTDAHIAQCRCTSGTADTGNVHIAGVSGNSATNYIRITVESGYRHNGTFPSSGNIYRISQTSNVVPFRTEETYLTVEYIAFEGGGSLSGRDVFETVSATPTTGYLKFYNCLASNGSSSSNTYLNRGFDISHNSGASGQEFFVVNCTSVNMNDYAFAFGSTSAANYIYSLSNTAYGAGQYGFRTYTSTVYFINCVTQDNTTNAWSASGSVSESCNNISDNGTAPGYNNVVGEVTFEDEGNEDIRLDTTDTVAMGKGTDLTLHKITKDLDDVDTWYDIDIIGTSRGPFWDCGSYQVNAVEAAFTRPDEDVSIGSWTNATGGTSNIYTNIDETTPSDTDYIKSEALTVISPNSSTCEIGLGNVTDPTESINHVIHTQIGGIGGSAANGNGTVKLMQSTTEIASFSLSALGTQGNTKYYTLPLSSTQIDNITDYSNLRLRFAGSRTSGTSWQMAVSFAELRTTKMASNFYHLMV